MIDVFRYIARKVARSLSNAQLARSLTRIDAKPNSIFWVDKEELAKEFKRREKLHEKRGSKHTESGRKSQEGPQVSAA